MQFGRLISFHLTQFERRMEQAAQVRAVLMAHRQSQADVLVGAFQAEHSAVYKRGGFEWQYGHPTQTVLSLATPIACVWEDETWPTYSVVAADGSQAMPDQRARYPWAAVHVASVAIHYGGDIPAVTKRLMIGPDDDRILRILTSNEDSDKRNAAIGAVRDRAELDILVEMAMAVPPRRNAPVLAMADGPLHIFKPSSQEQVEHLGTSLRAMTNVGILPMGFVNSGQARYTIRLAEILAGSVEQNLWPDITDFDVWGHLLEGERSPLFVLASSCNQTLVGCGFSPIGYFYVNIGGAISRVEVPGDVAPLHTLTSVLVSNRCVQGYPYELIKAHDLAVFDSGRRQEMDRHFEAELAAAGLSSGWSPKETLKAL